MRPEWRDSIIQYVEEHRQQMLEDVKTVVNMEGHYTEKTNVEHVREWFQKQFEAEGFQCYTREVAPDRAGLLVGILGKDRPGKPVLFSGHMDTVFHKGAFRSEDPFRKDGDVLTGPGVHDMKSGIVMILYIVRALNSIGWKERPIKIVLVGEEESDHIGNHADEMIIEECRGVSCAFNMESGREDNALCVGRKTQLTFYISVSGVGGHAGTDFLKGRNAINEMVYKLEQIIRLTDILKGTTVSPTMINGGIHGSAIPDRCEGVVDVRVDSKEEDDRICRRMKEILNFTHIEGTSTEYHMDRPKFHPYRENEQITKFHEFVSECSTDLGYEAFGKIHGSGAADSGNIAYAGVPVLCACGIEGGNDHSLNEFALLHSLYKRVVIFANVVADIEELEKRLS